MKQDEREDYEKGSGPGPVRPSIIAWSHRRV